MRVHGTFDVKMTPLAGDDATGGAAIGRMSIDKYFHGDLEGSSKGQMFGHMTAVSGSAGYVAMEIVTGTLAGKKGTFVLQHNATMAHGSQQLNIIVIPDSGTGELTGLAGNMQIIIDAGQHSYEFDYTI
jgi:hypothetical protein